MFAWLVCGFEEVRGEKNLIAGAKSTQCSFVQSYAASSLSPLVDF
jgi:hypothetical protein